MTQLGAHGLRVGTMGTGAGIHGRRDGRANAIRPGGPRDKRLAGAGLVLLGFVWRPRGRGLVHQDVVCTRQAAARFPFLDPD